jgi:DNA-binding CsgD family transcriptional regulator
VERAYDVDTPTPAWLDAIRDAADRAFGEHIATQAYTFAVRKDGRFDLHGISSDPGWADLLRRAHQLAAPAVIRRIYLRGPVCALRTTMLPHPSDPGYREVREAGLEDITLALGVDPSGAGCALAFLRRDFRALSRSTRLAVERVSAHLASARRLRGSLDPSRPADDLMQGAEAVVAPDGTVLHADGAAREAAARRALRDAARRIDKARCRDNQGTDEEPLALWRGLVEGRWSLVERFESDGRRILVARKNEPPARSLRALDERERKVTALLALGHSLKLCAYELGRAQSTTSELANSAMRKMGVGSRAELVQLHGAIVPTRNHRASSDAVPS